jgi:glycosyltransferase involved in cell wall biosynthesis
VRDAADLAAKMSQMLSLPSEQRAEMGLRGRAKMEAEFDEQIVIDRYLAVIDASHSEAQYRAVKRSVK